MPSRTSIKTTLASSFEAIQCAVVAPTLPAPTIVTFLRMNSLPLRMMMDHVRSRSNNTSHARFRHVLKFVDAGMNLNCEAGILQLYLHVLRLRRCTLLTAVHHIVHNVRGELAGLYLVRTGHQALKVVSHKFLLDCRLNRGLNQPCGFSPAHEVQHHHPRKHDRSGIDHIFVRILRCCAMGGLKDGVLVADVGARSYSQSAHLRGACVRNIVSVQVRGGQNVILRGPYDDLLEDRVSNTVIDHDLLLPRAVPMRLAD